MVITISGLILLSTYPHTVFAQKVLTNPNISAKTDRSSYIFGDTIVISGAVKTVLNRDTIAIQILDPYSNVIKSTQTSVLQDGSYIASVEITGSEWKSGGDYTVLVQYGSEAQTKTTFAFTVTTAPIHDTYQVQVTNNHQTYFVPYTIFGGSVTNMAVNTSNLSLTVSILSVNYGAITLSLPRSLIDAKTSDGTDYPFTILIDGVEITPQKEQVTSSDRTLTIQFLQGDNNIQIIGTSVASQNNSNMNTPSINLTTNQEPSLQIINMSKHIPAVPEFPTSVLVLLISVLLLILITRLYPKF
jgi:hypothetical protein